MVCNELVEHLRNTWRENKQIIRNKKLVKKHGEMRKWKEFAEEMAHDKQ